jgi:TATA-box binding protein (TBP) (component of TFIID and TFIIIB)
MLSVDEEWNNYVSHQSLFGNSGTVNNSVPEKSNKILCDDDNIRCEHHCDSYMDNIHTNIESCETALKCSDNEVPKCDDLYISTKTKVVFLNQEIDIHRVFWNIPIIEYWKPTPGVVKKQMKIISKTPEEFQEYRKKIEELSYYTENIIKQIDNPNARRIKFKDERKITIGTSKKDIMNCRGKVKNAFYNCFAIILRFKIDNVFREIHVKVFNTGKMEIPGILNSKLLDIVKEMVLQTLQPHVEKKIEFIENLKDENVLINSNFNCGFYINREKLYTILSKKYGIETSYDPCSYPGVKCKFYFNNELSFSVDSQLGTITSEDRSMKMSELGENKKYTEVSFMIFRTGSCLIVGNCSEKILVFIFEFIKKILFDEYKNIAVINDEIVIKNKKAKLRKKIISITNDYMSTICCK